MYKCRNMSQTCLHIGNICDSTKDCPFHDDELYCDLKDVKCPLRCNRLLLAIDCWNIFFLKFKSEIQPFYFSVSSSDIFSLQDLYENLENARVVKLVMNCIREIPKISRLNILLFDLGFNCLEVIMKNNFGSLYLLQTLNLNDNHITFIQTSGFHNLSNLKYLNLSKNPLMNLPTAVLKQSSHLKLFYIVNTSLVTIYPKALHGLHINVIVTTDYHVCCISSNKTLCTAYKPWYISCHDILPKYGVKIFFPLVSCVVIILNLTSIIFYLTARKSNKAFSVTVVSINLNDLPCGIYLGCIWGG